MATEMMMVPTNDYSNLVNYYKGHLTESALLNKAGRLAAERHLVLRNPAISDSVALAVAEPKAREVNRLTKRIRSGGVSSGAASSRHPQDEGDEGEDDLLKTPLESKLDRILRATQKRNRDEGGWVDVPPPRGSVRKKRTSTKRTTHAVTTPDISQRLAPSTPKRPRKSGGWRSAVGRGALKGVAKSWGISVDDDERPKGTSTTKKTSLQKKKKKVTPRAVKALRAAPGWEDFTEGRQVRRVLMPKYDDSDATTNSYDDYEKEEGNAHAWIPSFSANRIPRRSGGKTSRSKRGEETV